MKYLFAASALAAGMSLAVPAHAASARFTVDFPLAKTVGPIRAGTLCLPKGSMRGSDLVSDEGQFALLVRQVLDERAARGQRSLGDGAVPGIELHLKAAAVKLCAKSWGMFGMGDTKSLSGDVQFSFAWKIDGQAALNAEQIVLKPQSRDRLTAQAIMRRAVEAVLDRIAAKAV
ncbi:MAG: hypothetical protein ACKOVA_09920 [Novosphingobium sp.]